MIFPSLKNYFSLVHYVYLFFPQNSGTFMICVIRVYKGGGGITSNFSFYLPKILKKKFALEGELFKIYTPWLRKRWKRSLLVYTVAQILNISLRRNEPCSRYSHILKDAEFLKQLEKDLNVFFDIWKSLQDSFGNISPTI